MGISLKPAAKTELGERRVRFWVGSHGEFELLKEERVSGCCWAEDGGRFERRMEKRKERRRMVVVDMVIDFLVGKCENVVVLVGKKVFHGKPF